jgi:hypothetical protein
MGYRSLGTWSGFRVAGLTYPKGHREGSTTCSQHQLRWVGDSGGRRCSNRGVPEVRAQDVSAQLDSLA